MIVLCVTKTIIDLNQVLVEKGIWYIAIPSMLITSRARPDYAQATKLNYGDYLQAYINKGKTKPEVPKTATVLPVVWQLKQKRDIKSGSIKNYKARINSNKEYTMIIHIHQLYHGTL